MIHQAARLAGHKLSGRLQETKPRLADVQATDTNVAFGDSTENNLPPLEGL
jgi:hypothetical protein